MEQLFAQALASPAIRVKLGAEADGEPWRARVEIAAEGAVVGARGIVRAALTVRLHQLGKPTVPSIETQGILERSFDAEKAKDRKAELAELLKRGLPDLLKPIQLEAQLRHAPQHKLAHALSDPDPAVRKTAVRTVALRQEKASVPQLITLLKDPDGSVSDAAIGALVALGDQRAVHALCELVPMRDASAMAKVVDAIATLGGDEAQAYLEFVATGHENAEVRALAKEALERIQRKRP